MKPSSYAAHAAACNFRDPVQFSKLITDRHTEMAFGAMVLSKHLKDPNSTFQYFRNFFQSEVWPDGQGQDQINEIYYKPNISFAFNRFQRTMQVRRPNDTDECIPCYEEIGEGGYGTLPPMEMFEWHLKTKRHCVKNIRHIRQFKEWAKRIHDVRFDAEEMTMNMFYVMAALKTTGHKVTLEVDSDGNPLVNTNPHNPFSGFGYSYMDPYFPAPIDPNNIMPLTLDVLQVAARRWAHYGGMNAAIGTGPRGEYIYELWHCDDWFDQEILSDPDQYDRIRQVMPSKIFAGYNPNSKDREIIKNWSVKSMRGLPRLANTTDGSGLVPVQAFEEEDVEIGTRSVPSRTFLNAPFAIAMSPSPKQGKIMRRPPLTTDATGIPILPILGDGPWRINNEYDATCNPERNMPFMTKSFELGFKMVDPDVSFAIIHRLRKYGLKPFNTCDLQPVVNVDVPEKNCALTGRCWDNKRNEQAGVTKIDYSDYVEVSDVACGSSGLMHKLAVTRKANTPGFNSICADCGDTVKVQIIDEDGAEVAWVDATVKETMPHPYNLYWVELAEALSAGQCIKRIVCYDSTPTVAVALDCWDSTYDGYDGLVGIKVFTDGPLQCEVGDAVEVKYLDAEGSVITAAIDGTIAEADHELNLYRITGAGLVCGKYENQVKVTITCAAE